MAYQHEKEKYDEGIKDNQQNQDYQNYDEPNKSVSVKGCRVYSPAGIQFS